MDVYLVVEKMPGDFEPDRIVDVLEIVAENRDEVENHVKSMNEKRPSSWDNYFKLIGIKI